MKYDPLSRHIAKLAGDEWRARFSDIENVLGFKLPASARRYPAWWENDSKGHPHAGAWLKNGWKTTEVDLAGERLIFRRERSSRVRELRSKISRMVDKGGSKNEAPWPWDQPQELLGTLSLRWQPLGRATLDDQQRLSFPTVPAGPGLYRFTVRRPSGEQRYIGESQDLHRRFHHNYRNPAPRQQTSWRINRAFVEALAAGAQISIAIATEALALSVNGEPTAIDLSSKALRRMFEHFAQVCERDASAESLNR